jgi:excisionase family DNA binding protein
MRDEKVYTVKELSELLKIREAQVRNLLRRGVIKGFKVGKYWRVTTKEIDRLARGVKNWVDGHTEEEIK